MLIAFVQQKKTYHIIEISYTLNFLNIGSLLKRWTYINKFVVIRIEKKKTKLKIAMNALLVCNFFYL